MTTPGSLDRIRLRVALAMLAVVRFVVPRRQRAAWLAEWRGELLYLSSRESRHHPPARRPDVLAHSLHAIPHAAAHFKHEWSPDMLLQDLRYAARRLLKAPGFTVVAMLTVAIGVGANTAIFSVIDSTLLNPLPYPDADRLVFLWKQAPGSSLQTTPESEDIAVWRERATSFEDIQVYSSAGALTLRGGDEPRRLIGLRVLPGFFDFLGVQPLRGRGFSEEEGRLEERLAIIGYGLWRSHLGGADDVLGRTLTLDDEPYTVVGVMPRDFHFQAPFDESELWLPLSMANAEQLASPFAVARLAEGVSKEAADQELAAIAAAMAEETGEDVWPAAARRPQDLHAASFSASLVMLQAAVAMVLLIACANVANLLLARGAGQRGEMAMRAALGASRRRLLRQLLTEHLVLALAGGLLGYGLARGSVAAIALLRPESMTSLATLRVDGWIFFFAMGVAALTGALFGFAPALQASRQNLSVQLRESGARSSGARGRTWLRNALVVAEVGLAMLLLVGAGLLFSSLYQLLNVDLGFDTDNVLALSVGLPRERYPDDPSQRQLYDELVARLRQVGGARVEGIAAASGPLPTLGIWMSSFAAEGEEPREPFVDLVAHTGIVSPGYFTTLRVRFVDGRDFTADDVDSPDRPVIVNAGWAERMWPGERAVGKRIQVQRSGEPSFYRVVGVIDDPLLVGPTGAFNDLQIFRPWFASSSPSLIIRTSGDPLPLVEAFKEQVWAIDPDLPIENIARLDEIYAGRLVGQRFNVMLLGAFAAIAVLLAVIGVYGVLSYAVGQRAHEIGIRVALGARRGDVVPMIAWQGMRMVLLGVVIGIASAAALTRFIESLLYEVSAIDPATYVAVSTVVVAVAALACLIPALRAARVDAMEVLRRS